MKKFKTFIVLNVLLISSIACYKPACNGKYESGVLQFEKRIRRENIRGSMVGKHHYDTRSRQDLVAKADSKRHIINEVPKSEKDDCKSAFNEVSTRKNKSLLHEIARDLQKRAVKHQPKLTEKKKKNSKLEKQSTNEMENLLMAKLVALLKPIKKLNDPEPKHEYITLTRKKRYSNQNEYYMTPDQQILSMDENPLYNEEQNIIPERYFNLNDYDKTPDQQILSMDENPLYNEEQNIIPERYFNLNDYDMTSDQQIPSMDENPLYNGEENIIPESFLKQKDYDLKPLQRYIDKSDYLPNGVPKWDPSDIVGLGLFSGQTSSKPNINTIQPVVPSLENQGWDPSDIVGLGLFSGQTSSKPNINTIQPVVPSLENQGWDPSDIAGLGLFSGQTSSKPNINTIQPVVPSLEYQGWDPSDIAGLGLFSGQTSSKPNINTIQPVVPSLENQGWDPSDIVGLGLFSGQTSSKPNINTIQPVVPSLENQGWDPLDIAGLGLFSEQTSSKPNINTIQPVVPSLENQGWNPSDTVGLGLFSGQTSSKPNINTIQPVVPSLENQGWDPLDIAGLGLFSGQTSSKPNINTIQPVVPSLEYQGWDPSDIAGLGLFSGQTLSKANINRIQPVVPSLEYQGWDPSDIVGLGLFSGQTSSKPNINTIQPVVPSLEYQGWDPSDIAGLGLFSGQTSSKPNINTIQPVVPSLEYQGWDPSDIAGLGLFSGQTSSKPNINTIQPVVPSLEYQGWDPSDIAGLGLFSGQTSSKPNINTIQPVAPSLENQDWNIYERRNLPTVKRDCKPSDIVGLASFSGQTSSTPNINQIQPITPSLESQDWNIYGRPYFPTEKPDCKPSDIVGLASFSGQTSSKPNINQIQPIAPSLENQDWNIYGRPYFPTVKPNWEPSDILGLGLFSGQTASKANINKIQPVAPPLENQNWNINGRPYLPTVKPDCKPSDIVGLASFSGQTSSKPNINQIQPVAPPLENQNWNIYGRPYFPTVKPDWEPSDIVGLGLFSGQTSSKPNINQIQPVAPSLENEDWNIYGRRNLPTVRPDCKPSDIVALASFSGQPSSKPNINQIQPVAPSLENEDWNIYGRRNLPTVRPDCKPSDIVALASFSGQPSSKPNINQIQPVAPPLENQDWNIYGRPYFPTVKPDWEPSDILGLGLFSGQTSSKANINNIQPVAPSLENQDWNIYGRRNLPTVRPDCKPSDIVGLASFSGQPSSKPNINQIQPVAPPLENQNWNIYGRPYFPTVKPDWEPSDILGLGLFSGQTSSKANINQIHPVASSLENHDWNIYGRRFLPPVKRDCKPSDIVALASFSEKTSSKPNINKIQPVAPSLENQERFIDGSLFLPTIKPDWNPSDIAAYWSFSGQTLSKPNTNTVQPVGPSLENQERYIDGRRYLPTVKPDWKPSDIGALGSFSGQTFSKPNINTIQPVAPSLENQERFIGGRRFFPIPKQDRKTSDIEPTGSISGQTFSKPNVNQNQPITPPLENPLQQLKRYFNESGYLPENPNINTIQPVAPSPENPLQDQQNYGNENITTEKRRWKSSDIARGSFSKGRLKGPFVIIL
ncbi:uncharacterized protein [Rhodnius prolixus]|uniref:uncharacterized protein n=1 Tax=Rhodnius prolixus TaxID=13249 RepID=UPI003D189FF2